MFADYYVIKNLQNLRAFNKFAEEPIKMSVRLTGGRQFLINFYDGICKPIRKCPKFF